MESKKTVVLCTEDQENESDRFRRTLAEIEDLEVVLRNVVPGSVLEELDSRPIDFLVIHGGEAPDTSLALLSRIRSAGHILPILFLVSVKSRATALASLSRGADGFLIDEELEASTLRRALNYALLHLFRRRTERHLDECLAVSPRPAPPVVGLEGG